MKKLLLGCALAAAIQLPIIGAPVYNQSVDAADWNANNTRSVGSGLVAGGLYTDLSITWNISQNQNLFTYKYTFTGLESPEISHFILDLSDDCVSAESGCVVTDSVATNGTIGGLAWGNFTSSDDKNPNPFMGGDIKGVKFDSLDDSANGFYIQFNSFRAPVWGDFYVKGGSANQLPSGGGYAYNVGLADHSSSNVLDFIARPNGPNPREEVVPEPGTVALLGLGLAGIAFRRLRLGRLQN